MKEQGQGEGNGLRYLENVDTVKMTVQQDLWLQVKELRYYQPQGQQKGTWRINTQKAFSFRPIISCYKPFFHHCLPLTENKEEPKGKRA